MSEVFVLFLSQFAVHLDNRGHKTFADAWNHAKEFVDKMTSMGSKIRRMHDSVESCLASNPSGRVYGSTGQMWEFARYENSNTEPHCSDCFEERKMSKAFIARIII
jgi:hypothetical protein